MPYTQLSDHDRFVICQMNWKGQSQAAIARRLGRSPGTIGRELKRNAHPSGEYLFHDAHQRACERRAQANHRDKLEGTALGSYVRKALAQRWAPEQIAGRLRDDHPDDPTMRVSCENIYRWIYRQSQLGHHWHQQLRRRRKKRKRIIPANTSKRGQIRDRVGIEHRPAIVETRQRFGDWESDTVEGGKGQGLLATHVERASRFVLVRKLNDKRATTFNRASIAAFKTLPASIRKTLTADNGKEFAHFKQLEHALGLTVYFANPHAPWERGVNENTNGLLRDFFPKGSDLRRVSHQQVAKAQRMLNNRPRKCLNYRTPAEVLSKIPGVALRN